MQAQVREPEALDDGDDLGAAVGLPVDLALEPVDGGPPVVQQDVGHLLGGLAVAVHLVDDHVPARAEDAQHLREDRGRVGEVVQRVRDAGGVERAVGEGQVVGVHLHEADVIAIGERHCERGPAGGVRVDPDDLGVVAQAVEQELDEATGPGRDIEHAAAGELAEDRLGIDPRHRPAAEAGLVGDIGSDGALPTTTGARAASRAPRTARGSAPSWPARAGPGPRPRRSPGPARVSWHRGWRPSPRGP